MLIWLIARNVTEATEEIHTMFNFTSALVELNAGRSIQRGTTSNRNGNQPLHLKTIGKRTYLYKGNSPAEFDGDDISATDWQVVGTTSTRR
jgi:hypothetical protein